MDRLQWLAEAEISRLEELFKQPSHDEGETSAETEEVREETQRVRQAKKRS